MNTNLEEQLACIRNIRSSERRFYQKITDIYAQCSADYDLNEEITKQFFATVQNKLHWAITGQTAAEIIYQRVSNEKPNIGLTTWKNAPKGAIRKTDVSIAKNYLNEKELDGLNRIVTMYLDYAEMQAQKGIVMYMNDWVEKLGMVQNCSPQGYRDTEKNNPLTPFSKGELEKRAIHLPTQFVTLI